MTSLDARATLAVTGACVLLVAFEWALFCYPVLGDATTCRFHQTPLIHLCLQPLVLISPTMLLFATLAVCCPPQFELMLWCILRTLALPVGVWCAGTSALIILQNAGALGICQMLVGVANICLWGKALRFMPPATNPEETQKEEEAILTVFVVRISELQNNCNSICAMCLEEFQQDMELAQLPCLHVFHQDCLNSWLMRQRKCPFRCRPEPHAVHVGRPQVEATPPHEAEVSGEETSRVILV